MKILLSAFMIISLFLGQVKEAQAITTIGANISTDGNFIVSGQLRLLEGSPGVDYVAFKAPATLSANTVYTLPTAIGGPLTTLTDVNGDGTLSWVLSSAMPGPINGSVQFNSGGGFGGDDANFFWDNTAGAKYLRLGNGALAGELRLLEGSGTGTNYISLKAPLAFGSDVAYTLPGTVGGANTFLTDVAGNGTLSWATVSGGTNYWSRAGTLLDTATAGDGMRITGHSAFGGALIDTFGTVGPFPILNNTGATLTTNTDLFGVASFNNLDPIGAYTSSSNGGIFRTQVVNLNAQDFSGSTLKGIVGESIYAGTYVTNTSFSVIGGDFSANNEAGGTITNGAAVVAGVNNVGAGTITSAYGLGVVSPVNDGGGTIGTNYGILIQDQTDGGTGTGTMTGIGTNYNLYSAGASSLNVFEGSVKIGGATIRSGAGTPEGAVVGNIGDLFLRTDGLTSATLYIKETNNGLNTGWVAK